ncbi:hypothetical protein ACHAQJ_003569 [Trichoderma viride]
MPIPGPQVHVERDTWNEAALQLAWAPPPYEASRAGPTYMASKVEAEKAVWNFAEERKPQFTINTVNPSSIIGEPLHKKHIISPAAWIQFLYNGDISSLTRLPSIIPVDVKDCALLHVAAILDPEVNNARLQAWGPACSWNRIIAIARNLYPQREFVPNLPDLPISLTADFTEPLALLKKWGHQDEWTPLEQTIAENLKPIVAWDNSEN